MVPSIQTQGMIGWDTWIDTAMDRLFLLASHGYPSEKFQLSHGIDGSEILRAQHPPTVWMYKTRTRT